MRTPPWPPVPPFEMPPARTVRVPDRGEFFLRDSGGDGSAVMLLHGWMATADLNWAGAYAETPSVGVQERRESKQKEERPKFSHAGRSELQRQGQAEQILPSSALG